MKRASNRKLDLNLLEAAVALFEEGTVSRAAARLGVSQPSMSASLAKLRAYFSDPLFVRSASGMAPTPRAEAMVRSARDILHRIEAEVLCEASFDPAATRRPFVFALSDVGEIVFLPPLIRRLGSVAPHTSIQSLTLKPSELAQSLENGQVDLAIGYFPDLDQSGFFQQRLFSHHFTCLLRHDHPIQTERLTLDQFVSLQHAVVHSEGRSQEIFERFLAAEGVTRQVALSTPHFLSIPAIISKSDMVVTVPHAVGIAYGHAALNLRCVAPPFRTPRIDLRQHWHRRFHQDPRHRWLRGEVSALFNDKSDEWARQPVEASG
jgi:DNA-binding transcriptional LysR family regulator